MEAKKKLKGNIKCRANAPMLSEDKKHLAQTYRAQLVIKYNPSLICWLGEILFVFNILKYGTRLDLHSWFVLLFILLAMLCVIFAHIVRQAAL